MTRFFTLLSQACVLAISVAAIGPLVAVEKSAADPDDIALAELTGFAPVSYTHLDVYKRQA